MADLRSEGAGIQADVRCMIKIFGADVKPLGAETGVDQRSKSAG